MYIKYMNITAMSWYNGVANITQPVKLLYDMKPVTP